MAIVRVVTVTPSQRGSTTLLRFADRLANPSYRGFRLVRGRTYDRETLNRRAADWFTG